MRRSLQQGISVLAATTCLLAATHAGAQDRDALPVKKMFVYVGSYADEQQDGIHICQLNLATGHLERVGGVAGIKNPSFQVVHPNGRFLYSVSEADDFDGQSAGAVCAYAVDRATGALKFLNRQSTMGPDPCHLTVDRAARHVLAANYSGGSVVVLPIASDGGVELACAFVQHQGSSVHPRQQGPHAHCVNMDPTGEYLLVADLGTDQVVIYKYDQRGGQITPNPEMPAATVTPGAGPRHFAFHPQGQFGYVINELNSTVTAFRYESHGGKLTRLQDISTLPADFHGESTTAEIAVAPNGKFLYGSNRGHDSIAVFSIDPQTGQLTAVSHHSTLGEMPRNFALDPTGNYLLAANQRTGSVVVYRIDHTTGQLTPTGSRVEIPKPVCVTFLE